jgi:hypothetical protein
MKTLVAIVALSAVVAGPAFAQAASRNHAFHHQSRRGIARASARAVIASRALPPGLASLPRRTLRRALS